METAHGTQCRYRENNPRGVHSAADPPEVPPDAKRPAESILEGLVG
jgi:hypothetical protein